MRLHGGDVGEGAGEGGVFLPYAPEGRMTRLYQTRLPTKLSEYCWAGMPILVTGPEDAKGSRWAKRHPEAAVTGNCYAGEILGPILKKLASETDWRSQMAQGVAQASEIAFDNYKIRAEFSEEMISQ